MSLRACVAVSALIILSGCAELGIPELPPLEGQPRAQAAPAPVATVVNTSDPAFHYVELTGGLPKGRLEGMYGGRLIYVEGDTSYERYVVEPSTAAPGTAGRRSRLVLWVMDGHLATWAMEDTSAPVAVAMLPPPPVQPMQPARARASAAASGHFMVQIAASQSEADARATIDRLRAKHTALLGQRGSIINRVSLPQGVFYRAVVGPFGSQLQANELCNQLRARGDECFVRS